MTLPGYLYAKSLRRQGLKASGYSRLFLNAALSRYEGDIALIQDTFEWSVYSDESYAPVVAYRKVQDGVLVVRFFDEGLDAFRRPHTLRVEGMLATSETLASALDGSNEWMPNEDDATFEISGDGRVAVFDEPETQWRFIGDEATYSCLGCGRGGEEVTQPLRSGEEPIRQPSPKCQNQKERQIMRSGGICLSSCLLVIAVVALGGFSFYQYRQSESLVRQLNRVREKLRASDERQKELQKWYDDRLAFSRDLSSAKKSVVDLERELAVVKSSLNTMERRLNMMERRPNATDFHSEARPTKSEAKTPTKAANRAEDGVKNTAIKEDGVKQKDASKANESERENDKDKGWLQTIGDKAKKILP